MRLLLVVLFALAAGCEDEEDIGLKVANACVDDLLAADKTADGNAKRAVEWCCPTARASKRWAARSIRKKCDQLLPTLPAKVKAFDDDLARKFRP